MSALSLSEIAGLLQPYVATVMPEEICAKVSRYLDLFARWSGRVSLSSVKEPAQVVQRHFGESFFLAAQLPAEVQTLLDFGSGAGFPGIPAALLRPQLQITLAESQGRKAAFLREAVFDLGLRARVWPDRVEKMPVAQVFDAVALRAVDRMDTALKLASERVGPGGTLAFLAGETTPVLSAPERWQMRDVGVPLSSSRLVLATRLD